MRTLLHIISVMESLIRRNSTFKKGDLIKFTTELQGTGLDRISGKLGIVTAAKGGKISVLICEVQMNDIPVGCVEHVRD